MSGREGEGEGEGGGFSHNSSHQRRREGSDVVGEGGTQFHLPLHYPNYTKADYETMPEWRLDCLLQQYGLPLSGDLQQKRLFAIGAFLWPYSHHLEE